MAIPFQAIAPTGGDSGFLMFLPVLVLSCPHVAGWGDGRAYPLRTSLAFSAPSCKGSMLLPVVKAAIQSESACRLSWAQAEASAALASSRSPAAGASHQV